MATPGALDLNGTASQEGNDEPLLKNVLNQSRSPYVSQPRCRSPLHISLTGLPQVRGHMNNPVAWQMWGPEAIDLAKRTNKMLFVSIGYAACHCRS